MTPARSTRAAAATGLLLIAWVVWYLGMARGSVVEAYGHSNRWVIKNLLAGNAAVTLRDYLDAADRLAVMVGVTLAAISLVLVLWRYAEPVTARLYGTTLRACDACLARRRLAFTLGGVACISVLAIVAVVVLQEFPNSGDEYGYLYGAETFVHGRTWNPAHPLQEFFEFTWIRQMDGRVFAIFPPGWPAVLASAQTVHVPLWLVNPVCGWLSLVLVFLIGRRLYDERTALVAVAATFASSFFLFNGGSYFSHTFCSVLILAVAYFGTRAIDERRTSCAVLAGAAAGAALITRNYTAVWCSLPLAVALLAKGRFGRRAILACAAAGVPFVLAYLTYNASTTGHPFVTGLSGTFGQFDQQFFPSGWMSRALENLGGRLVSMTWWTPPALIGLYAWWWRLTPRHAWRFSDFIFPCLVFGYFIYMDRGGNRYGPRFWYEAYPLVVLSAVSTVVRETSYDMKTRAGKFAWYLLPASMVACLGLFAWHAVDEAQAIWMRREPARLASRQNLDHAVVFLSTRTGGPRPMTERDLTRNGVEASGRILFVRDLGPEDARLMEYYPDRSFFRYRYDRDARVGRLEPVARVPAR